MRWIATLILTLIALAACGSPTPTTVPPTPIPTATPTLEAVAFATPTAAGTFTATPGPAIHPPTPEPTATPIVYLVEEGDTLIGIAVRHGISLEAIQLANPDLRPDLLQIGQQVIIPHDPDQPVLALGFLPSPTPLPLPLSGFGLYETPTGGVWALGEVLNETDSPIVNARINLALFGSGGTPLGTMDAWAALDIIPPGRSAPFGFLFPSIPAQPATHRLTLETAELYTNQNSWYPDLVVSTHEGGPAGAVYRVTGTVANTGMEPAEKVTVVVTLYNPEQRVTGFRVLTLTDPLPPAGSAPFDMQLSPAGPDTDHYAVAVTGRRATSP